jgi:hypothetical protein
MKYKYNKNYFEKIDSHEKAYWLGFILADGNLQDNRNKENKSDNVSLRIRLSEIDKDHLEKFLRCLDSDKPVRIVKNYGKYKNQKDSALLELNSRKMVDDLKNKNIETSKSCNEKPYYELDEQFLPSYILGIFDGDGSFTSTKNHEFSIFSSTEVCDFIEKHLENKLDIKFIKRSSDHRCSDLKRIRTRSKSNIIKIFNYLYSESLVYLERKKIIIDKFLKENIIH